LAVVASKIAERPARGAFTYGFARVDALAGQANGITLLVLAVWFLIEAIRRLIHPPNASGAVMTVVALIGVAVNVVATGLAMRANRSSLNVCGAVAHLLNDLWAFAATFAAGVAILASGWTRADAVASLIVAALMTYTGVRLVHAAGRVFLQAAPTGVDPQRIGAQLATIDGVAEVHDLHVWDLGPAQSALSAHVLVRPQVDCHEIGDTMRQTLARDHQIQHVTLQVDHLPETAGEHCADEPPEGADAQDMWRLFQEHSTNDDVAPVFRRRARRSITTAGLWAWEEDGQFDIDHHVRHSGLPRPGRVLELLALCSRLHSTLLDRHRPLWETHLIEGLGNGRLAVYSKLHHAVMDGVTAARWMQRVLSPDPGTRNMPPPWAKPPERERPAAAGLGGVAEGRGDMWHVLRTVGSEAAALPGALVRTVNRAIHEEATSVSFSAPKTILNVRITGARRFAAQSWPIDRLRAIARSSRGTLNDVVLAMSSGALRRYLMSLDALPDAPLIAMVPVALRTRDRDRQSGNAVGAVMCNLGTHMSDPAARLRCVQQSMAAGKQALSGMSPVQILVMSGLGMSPLALEPLLPIHSVLRPPFNLIISNVPGSRVPLYWNGARLVGVYPLSIPVDGQALNITSTSYADHMAFGLTGCRRSVPHLQRLLDHLDHELGDLEKAVGIS
jgi:diacylglycerol O-acyltransferase